MWRLRHAARLACRSPLQRLCADAAAIPIPKPRPPAAHKPRGTPGKGKAVAVCGAVAGIGYVSSEDLREMVDEAATATGEAFEDFNDYTRDVFESIGDRIVAKKQEPWLLDLATMKYPESIPTLVLDLDKVILLLEHDSKQGWQVIKRPFADQFFKEISHYYEVVLFSDDVFPVALDIATKWNLPVTAVLHREFCKKKRNHFVKDLSKLGRKLDRVLLIDHDPAAFQLQPENGVLIKEFHGDTSDSELADLLEFLKAAATHNGDIRQFVQKFGGGDFDVGRRYLLHKQDHDKQVERRRSVGRVFGPARVGLPPGGPPPKPFGPNMR